MEQPQISRRKFFGLLGGVVAATVAPPIHVLAPPQGWNLDCDYYSPAHGDIIEPSRAACEALGFVFYDLRGPVELLYPEFTLLRRNRRG